MTVRVKRGLTRCTRVVALVNYAASAAGAPP
jgi:hypothetical protein